MFVDITMKVQPSKAYDERKQNIMSAALKVFSRRGIIGAKMSMIAKEAKVSQGLFYHYFKSKEELFASLVQEALEESAAAFEKLYQLAGSPKERLKRLTESVLDSKGASYFMLLYQAGTSDGVPAEIKELLQPYSMKSCVDLLTPLFREGQQAGEFAEGQPKDLIAAYLAVLGGIIVLNSQKESGYSVPEAGLLMRMVVKS